MIDCHTHLLPGIDDGSRSVEESLEILSQLQAAGIETAWATPHFYPDDEIEKFCARREEAYERLMESLGERVKVLPRVIKGAEVLLSVDTPDLEHLEKLCIEGTRYILIELPYMDWSEWVYQALYKLIVQRNLVPVLAHIERYEKVITHIDKINRLAQMNVLMQMNAYSLLGKHKRFALRMVKHHMIQVLGSDVHSHRSRGQVSEAYHVVVNKVSRRAAGDFKRYAEQILADERIIKKEFRPLRKRFGIYY